MQERCQVTHLKDAGQADIVEDGKEDVGRCGHCDGVADPHHPELRAEHVHFGRHSEHGDGGHEAGELRQRHRQQTHVAVGQHVLPSRPLSAASTAKEQPDTGRNEEHRSKGGVVPSRKHGGSVEEEDCSSR